MTHNSLYPFIMTKYNISAETVLCDCCKDSKIRVPDVGYNICEKREGVIPLSLKLILDKRIAYKQRKKDEKDPDLKARYEARVEALKGILVCSFGYLSYRNAKFGLIDCHIAVCAYARKILLDTAKIAERRGFEVVHGIVDSLWVKKEGAKAEDFESLRAEIEREIGLPVSFDGLYRWIAFLPSRVHRGVPVLNRYFGVYQDGSMKLRGIEERRRDTIKLVSDCQKEILQLFAAEDTADGVRNSLPDALGILRSYVELLKSGEAQLADLLVANRLSKNFNEYRTRTAQSAAVTQLAKEGLELVAGQNVAYVVTNFKSKNPEEKVRPYELLDDSTRYDRERYVEMLVRGISTILEPFGLDEEKLLELVEDPDQYSQSSKLDGEASSPGRLSAGSAVSS